MKIRINNEEEAKDFTKITNTFISPIDLIIGSNTVDAKSILGVLALGLYKDFDVEILTDNKDECAKFLKDMGKFKICQQ